MATARSGWIGASWPRLAPVRLGGLSPVGVAASAHWQKALWLEMVVSGAGSAAGVEVVLVVGEGLPCRQG